MTNPLYKRFSRVLRRSYPSVAATVALVVALVGVPGVTAGGLLVTTKQIKNGTIRAKDIHKGAIRTASIRKNAVLSADIQTGAIESSDIGEGQVTTGDIGTGQVTPEDVTMPAPGQLKFAGTATIEPPQGALDFAKLVDLGTYTKSTAESALEVTWTGSVEGRNGGEVSGCVFQLRIDGKPAPGGGGEVFGLNLVSVSSSAVFTGLSPGPHTIEVWAKVNVATTSNRCTVGPEKAGVDQTVVASEKVL
ncbi:MAG TPA: hypothetical protein VFK14_00155 [Solirubrobacterales bacterium]|nr:hypothetical protein [Solirubrobacterales bacterium]